MNHVIYADYMQANLRKLLVLMLAHNKWQQISSRRQTHLLILCLMEKATWQHDLNNQSQSLQDVGIAWSQM